jgi:TIR domain
VRIALGDRREDFWEREPEEINAEIVGWLREKGWRAKEPEFDFFLSFNKDDLDEAKFISDTLEDEGYSVFSQFNDMKAGNFVGLMNRGLEGMSRFIAVYSPDYFKSPSCSGEWQAALTFDASGNSGKFIAYMVRISAPPAILRGIIYHPLYHLPKDKKKAAILQAVLIPATPRDRAAQRHAAKMAVSPDVIIDSSGQRIDLGSNSIFDQVHADTDLFDLPERIRQVAAQLSELLAGRNNCYSIKMSLDAIVGELDARGLDCSLGLLADQIEFIQMDIESGDSSLLMEVNNTGTRFKKLFDLFASMRAHYPLDQSREAIFRQANINIKSVDQMEEVHKELAYAIQTAADEDLVTDHYKQVIENRIRVTKDVLSIPDPIVPQSDDLDFVAREEDRFVRVQTSKRRALAQDAAIADKTIEVAASLATIADSTAGKALIEVMKRLGNWIWGA